MSRAASTTAEPLDVSPEYQPSLRDYARVTAGLALLGLGLAWLVGRFGGVEAKPTALLGPVLAVTLLTAAVWIGMVAVRNYATLRKLARGDYFRTYQGQAPPDWVERPARTFNNLMQLPWLFHAVCAWMLLVDRVDAAQLALAWVFVALRVLHAVVYMAVNHLPTRFGSWAAGAITLWTLWWRLADQAWSVL